MRWVGVEVWLRGERSTLVKFKTFTGTFRSQSVLLVDNPEGPEESLSPHTKDKSLWNG